MTGPIAQEWGGIGFNGLRVSPTLMDQTVPRLQVGSTVSRAGREVITSFVVDDYSGGFLASSVIRDWARDKNRFYKNTGVETHIAGMGFMAPVLTTNTSIIASDHSGIRAGNRRVHSAMFMRRFIAAVGPNIIKDTSTSNSTLIVPVTADAVTDDVMSMWEGEFNSIRYLVVGTDGQTDDVMGTADPTADTITWVELMTQGNANDAIYAGAFMETLGNGWNVMIGKNGDVNGIWAIKRDASLPVTAPTPVVYADTFNIEGSIATVTAGEVSLGQITEDSSNGGSPWGSSTSSSLTYSYKWLYGGDFSAIPLSAVITGIQPDMTFNESGQAVITIDAIQIFIDGSVRGLPFGGGDSRNSDGDLTFGSSTITFSTRLTGSDLRAFALRVEATLTDSDDDGDYELTSADVQITYRDTGSQASLPEGGFSPGALKSNPLRLPYIAPQSADKTGVTQTRELYFCDFAFDPSGDRPVVSISKPNTNLTYVGIAADYQGGLALAGGHNELVWDEVKLIDASNRTLDLRFPGVHGTDQQTITQMYSQGNILFVDTAYTDGSEAQLWMYFDGKWSVAGVQQDLSSAISTEPLLWAETTIGTQNKTFYRLFPVSTSALATAEQIIRSNMFKDPWLDTAITRHDDSSQSIYVQSVEMAAGPPEANATIVSMQFQSRKMDDNTLYGSVGVSVEVGGDVAMSSPAINGAGGGDIGKFNAASEAFVERNIVAAKVPGVTYDTVIFRLAPGHQAGSTETPSILPVVFNLVHSWPHLQEYAFVLDPSEQRMNILELRDRMITLSNTKTGGGPVRRLLGSGIDEPAILKDFQVTYRTTPGKQLPVNEREIESVTVIFQRTLGSIS